MSTKTLFRSSYLLPKGDAKLIEDGAVVWDKETILEVGDYNTVQSHHPEADVKEYKDHLILPGLVNAHDHGTGVGYPQMGAPDLPLELWLPLLYSSRYPDPYLGALYYGLLLLSNGITTTMHQHDPRDMPSLERELQESARGYRDAGIKASISLTLSDQNQLAYIGDQNFIDGLPNNLAKQVVEAGLGNNPLKENDFIDMGTRLRKEWAGEPRTWLCWGPHGPHACSDDLLKAIHAEADGDPIQIHLLETRYQQTHAEKYYGKSTAAHLESINFLTPNVSCAHSIWLTEGEKEILASTKSKVVHCPSSNLRLRSGIAPVLDLHQAGVDIGIGLDGVDLSDDQNMFLEMRLAHGLAFEPGIEGRNLTARQVIKMATEVGARIVGRDQTGRLETGAEADLFTLRLDRICQPYLDERMDLIELVLLKAQPRDIDTVVVAGEVLIRHGKHLKQDIQEVASLISESFSSHDTDDRLKYEKITDAIMPYIKEVYTNW